MHTDIGIAQDNNGSYVLRVQLQTLVAFLNLRQGKTNKWHKENRNLQITFGMEIAENTMEDYMRADDRGKPTAWS